MTGFVVAGIGLGALALLLRGYPPAVRVALAVTLLLGTSLGVPALARQARDRAEGPVLQNLYLIAIKQEEYRAAVIWDTDGDRKGEYASLQRLYRTRPPLINDALAAGTEYGYVYNIELAPDADTNEQQFYAYAVPVRYGVTGRRSVYVDESGIVRVRDAGPVTNVTRAMGQTWEAVSVPGVP